MRSRFLISLCLAYAFALSGCDESAPPDPEQEVGRALDAVELSQKESELIISSIVALDPGAITGDEAANLAALRATKVFSPADCVQAKAEGNAVTYQLNRCWGPFKSHTLTGKVVAVYSTSEGVLYAYLHAEELKVGKFITLDIDSEATLSMSPSDDTKVLTVETKGIGTGSRGNRVERKGNYTLTFRPITRCMTFQGDFTTIAGARSAHTAITDYARCAGECPTAPGRIVYETSVGDYSVTIQFDGTSQASWTSSDGASGQIDLFCGTSS